MEPVTASLNVTLDSVTVEPVTPPEAYFSAAEALMSGVQLLAPAVPQASVALTLLAGQALECLLKAYLAKNGTPESELKQYNVRHNLKDLWQMANRSGLQNAAQPPPWVECLSGLHNRPFYLRYPMELNAIVLPGAQPMASELETLMDAVRQGIR